MPSKGDVMLVEDVMTRRAVTVTADTRVKRAVELLAEHRISSLPVVDHRGRLCGVVSEADLVRDALAPDPRAHERPTDDTARTPARLVSEVMTPHAVTVRAHDDLAEAVDLMTSTSVKSLPVVDDDHRVVGMVSRSDVIRLRARSDEQVEQEVDSMLVSLGHRDWLVEVHDGVVEIDGPDTSLDRSIAEVAATTVPGVVQVRVR